MKRFSRFLSLLLVTCLLVGCVDISRKQTVNAYSIDDIIQAGGLAIPSWVSSRIELQAQDSVPFEEEGRLAIHTYYDNTQSMWGYGQMAGEAGCDGFRFFHLMTALRDTNKAWNIHRDYAAVSHILAVDGGSELLWREKSEDEIWTKYNNVSEYKEFYTGYNSATLPRVSGEAIGPLSLMFYGKDFPFDPKQINVIITDLAEQNQGSVSLATNLYSKVLSQGGYAICIFAMHCRYKGITYRSDENLQDQMVGTSVDSDTMPLYMILSGPDEQLGSYVIDILNGLKSQGEEVGQQYWMSYYQPGKGYIEFKWNSEYTSFERVITEYEGVTPESVYIPESMVLDSSIAKNCNWTESRFQTLYALEEQDPRGEYGAAALLNAALYAQVEGVHVFRYQHSERNIGNEGYFALNYYVPLPEDTADVIIGLGNASEQYLCTQFNYTSERLSVDSDPIVEPAPLNSEDSASSRRRRQTASSDPSTEDVLEENANLSWMDDICTEKAIDTQLHLKTRLLTVKDGIAYDPEGEIIPKAELELSRSRRNADYMQPFLLDIPDGIILQISITGNLGTYPGSAEIFDLPVYVVRQVNNGETFVLPEWIGRFSGNSPDKSYRFEYVCRQMFGGLDSKIDADSFSMNNAVLITDIFTVITDLP